MKSVAKMAAVAFAGIGSGLVVLFCASILAAASKEEDELRKQFDEMLDHYAGQAKDVAQRAQKQLQQLQNDAKTLLDRWESEVANVPLAQYPPWEGGKFTGVVGCTQPTGPLAKIPGDGLSPVPTSSIYIDPPPIPPATYTSAQFETWKKVELGFFEQSQKQLDTNLKWFLALLDDRRKRLGQIDQQASQPNKGVNWKAFQYQGLKGGMYHYPNGFFNDTYSIVVTAYAELLYLHAVEIGGGGRTTKSGLVSPPGQTCLIDFQQSSSDYTDHAKFEKASHVAIVTSPERQPPLWGLVANQDSQALHNACASDEQTRRDTAVSQFRPIRDRYYAERSPIRDRLLAWRKEAVAGGFYEGSGDADATVVYGKESDLSPENVYSGHIPFDRPIHVYYLRVLRPHAQTALDTQDQLVDSGWALGPLLGHGIGAITINLNTECIRETAPGGSQLTAKYPDLEVQTPFVLEIPLLPHTDYTGTVKADSSQRNPRVYLYAVTATGLQAIDDLFVGVPTIIELQFILPYDKPTFDFQISAGGDSLKLTAKQLDQHGRIYRTDPFLPVGAKSNTGSTFSPPNGAPK